MWFSLEDIREMSDQEIKSHYYAMINQSRHEFNEKQKIERYLESPLLMCCFMVLLLMMAFIFLFFIWIAPKEGFQLFLFFGTPLFILLFTTRHYRKKWLQKKQKINLLHHQLDDFRAKLEKARKEIPAYPFTGTSSYYPYEKFDSYPFDEYS
ncbi:hypothetical protein [Alkalihalobacterium sp. APHAB7]|uniref:hypothetical protein n=1 Tax=Alkalihalobacterium sp. APHAB7 TaxID=3402081 RepID=UPI003AAD18A1